MVRALEVVLADNGSTDETVAIVSAYKGRVPNLRIIDASARRGQPYALNRGATAASGESIVFCDADDLVGEGFVAAMGNALTRYDFVACRLDLERLNPPWIVASRGRPQSVGLQQYRYPPYLPHAGGGTIGVKRLLYASVGGGRVIAVLARHGFLLEITIGWYSAAFCARSSHPYAGTR